MQSRKHKAAAFQLPTRINFLQSTGRKDFLHDTNRRYWALPSSPSRTLADKADLKKLTTPAKRGAK